MPTTPSRRSPVPQIVTPRGPSPRARQLWKLLFVLWLVMISGVFERVGGGPGVIQLVRLKRHLEQRQLEQQRVEADIQRLEQLSGALQSNAALQEREIRRVLGYVAPGELIFDFVSDFAPN